MTRHGEAIAVVIDIDEYHRLRGEPVSLMEYLRAEPLTDEELVVERRSDMPREIDLAG